MQRDLVAARRRIVALLLIALAPARNIFQRRFFSFEGLASYRETIGRKDLIQFFAMDFFINE